MERSKTTAAVRDVRAEQGRQAHALLSIREREARCWGTWAEAPSRGRGPHPRWASEGQQLSLPGGASVSRQGRSARHGEEGKWKACKGVLQMKGMSEW